MDNETEEDWEALEQEFHEWQVLTDVVALVQAKGLQYVLSKVLDMMKGQDN